MRTPTKSRRRLSRPRAWARLALLGGAALVLGCGPTAAPDGRGADPPNVLLVVLDTTRASAVSAYGDPRAHTPHLDRLAAEGVLFTNARATSSWTLPTHAAIFTGLHSFQHDAHHETDLLADEQTTLAEILAPTHATAGFSENPHIIRRKGFAQGFEIFEETWRPTDPAKLRKTVELFTQWLRERDRSRPFFAFVNLFSSHLPYAPPPRWQRHFFSEREIASGRVASTMRIGEADARHYMTGEVAVAPPVFDFLTRLYLADAAHTDERLGRVLDALRQDGVLDDTLVVVVSDHGENIGEHGLMEHQFGLYETVLRVPMILRLPGTFEPGERRNAPAQLTDVAPTVLDVLGAELSLRSGMAGVSLTTVDPAPDRPVLAEYMRPVQQRMLFAAQHPGFDFDAFDRRLRSLQIGDYKLIASDRGDLELYDLSRDPEELEDLAAREPERAARMQSQLMQLAGDWVPRKSAAAPALDAETRAKLRELGYTR